MELQRRFIIEPKIFRDLGAEIGGWNTNGHHWIRQFCWMFRVTPLKCSMLFDSIIERGYTLENIEPTHLLWGLLLARTYGTEEVMATMCDTTAKTFRYKAWNALTILSRPRLIDWENRLIGAYPWNRCRVSVDGMDFRMREPRPFDPRWFSHKFNGPALRYEIAISISTGWIVWVMGPFPAGEWPDLRIVRESLNHELDAGEQYIADGGYYDGYQWAVTPRGLHEHVDRVRALVRARHENINGRFKQWRALCERWRHAPHKHGVMFRAIANVIQMGLRSDEPAWPIQYNEREF